MGTKEKKNTAPGIADIPFTTKCGTNLVQTVFCSSIETLGDQRSLEFRAKTAGPVVFRTGAGENQSPAAEPDKILKKFETCLDPANIFFGIPIFPRNRIPREMQKMCRPNFFQYFFLLSRVKEITRMQDDFLRQTKRRFPTNISQMDLEFPFKKFRDGMAPDKSGSTREKDPFHTWKS